MRWEIKTLEDAVRAQHGDSVAGSLHEATQSIAWKINMAYYHACESVRILKEAIYESDVISADDHESIAAAKSNHSLCRSRLARNPVERRAVSGRSTNDRRGPISSLNS